MVATASSITSKLDKEISNFVKKSSIGKKYISSKKDVTYSDFLSNKMLMIFLIRQGVPYALFNSIQDYAPFTEEEWADLLDISTKSLQRYKQASKRFKSLQSEKIIEMAEVTTAGLDVFEEMDKFKLWLETPNFALGNMKPLELLKDSYGKELVLSELIRINYGILS